MDDRKIAISDLDSSIRWIEDIQCHQFPGYLNVTISMRRALELLKEQEAVKPKVTSAEQRCGNCNKVIEMDGWKSCPWCGRPIAWSEWWNENGGREAKWE